MTPNGRRNLPWAAYVRTSTKDQALKFSPVKQLLAEAAWLERCTYECPWPIVTALDLSEFASNILSDPLDDLTVGEVRRIEDLIKRLKPLVTPPEQLAREAKEEERRKKRLPVDLFNLPVGLFNHHPVEKEEKWRRWQIAGACARAKKASARISPITLT